MELIIKDKKAQCPICSGIVHELIINTLYRCYDCRMLYQVKNRGYAEGSLEVETVMEGLG
jgi:uncharacterized Zn finger protein